MLTIEEKSHKLLARLNKLDEKGNRERTVVHWVNTTEPGMPIVDLEIINLSPLRAKESVNLTVKYIREQLKKPAKERELYNDVETLNM